MARKRKYFQGFFKPAHPEKYIGDVNNIVYRSGYELAFLRKIDENPDVLKYTSETVIIRYYNPVKCYWARYFVDVLMEVKLKNGKTMKYLVEIKPASQLQPPKQGKKHIQTYLTEAMEYSQNQAKWKAAQAWCDERNITFTIVTVDEKTKKFVYIDASKLILQEDKRKAKI